MRKIAIPALLALAVPLAAQQPGHIDYTTFTLDNGLEVVVHEDHSVPIVAVNIWYDVGSANEVAGRSGFAHLFEHMLFQETANMDKGEFMQLIPAAGGDFNGTTNEDRTAYFEILPSNRLNLAMWAEADRMARLQVTDDNFQREREVVKEERRRSYENRPYGIAFLTVDTLAEDYPPYKHTVIGSMDDLNAATSQDVLDFYHQFYVPNNATLVVAGDVTPGEVREMAEKYFGDIPRGPERAPLPAPTASPRTSGERRLVLEDKQASTPLLMQAYNIPPAAAADIPALELLATVLGQGESSRLFQSLVKDEQAAVSVSMGTDTRVGPGLLSVFALPNQGVDVSRLESLIDQTLERARAGDLTERELQKAKNQRRARTIMQRQRVFSRAMELQSARLYEGDIDAVNTELQKYDAVTLDDLTRVAKTYLTPRNRTTVIAVPEGQKAQMEGRQTS